MDLGEIDRTYEGCQWGFGVMGVRSFVVMLVGSAVASVLAPAIGIALFVLLHTI